jgi:hypothetical protein
VIVIRNSPAYRLLIARLHERGDLGASLVEWAIFAAIAVVVVGFVGTLIWNKVT